MEVDRIHHRPPADPELGRHRGDGPGQLAHLATRLGPRRAV
jgi:hypothetical protein